VADDRQGATAKATRRLSHALTNAEKQRRYIQRLKERAAAPLQEPRNSEEVARLLAIVARVRRAMRSVKRLPSRVGASRLSPKSGC
jgi:hypothetical protein